MSPHRTDHLADLRTDLQQHEPGRPRITWYVVDGGPSDGERVELSGAVLANWASKAAGLLQDELDAGPGSAVHLDLPPHWRSLYWTLAALTVGATVTTDPAAAASADVLVTTDPSTAPVGPALVVVTLAALARSAPSPVPPEAIDEARELATFPDAVTPYARAAGHDLAISPSLPYAGGDAPDNGGRRLDVVGPGTGLADWLPRAIGTIRAGGSLVTVRSGDDPAEADRVAAVARQERATGPDPV